LTRADEPLTVVLELASDREPVEGSVRIRPGETRAFTGWMELVAALEDARSGELADSRPDARPTDLSAEER
jgi:hypothetical protein